MSAPFNDTTNLGGLLQAFEKEIGANQGDWSGSTTKLKEFAMMSNQAFAPYWAIALNASGTWQFDDSNQTDYPIIKTNIVSGQRDYSFGTDGSSNLILEIYKVAILKSATATTYEELDPVDTQSESNLAGDFNSSTTGVPSEYDKTANGIIFRTTPNYNATNGLLVYINREGSFFTSSDTTKKPGVPGIHHAYFYLRPALEYARRNNLTNYPLIQDAVLRMEQDIAAYFGRRSRDARPRLTVGTDSNK